MTATTDDEAVDLHGVDDRKVGSLLASIAREAGGLTEAEAEHFDRLRDRTPAEPIRFE